MEQRIGNLIGSGFLQVESDQVPVKYHLTEFEQYGYGADGDRIPLTRSLRGKLLHQLGHPHWHPLAVGGPYELTMSDSRKVNVFITDSSGAAKSTGPIFNS